MFVPPKKWTLLKRKMDVYYDENDSDEEYSEITKVPITDNVYENEIEKPETVPKVRTKLIEMQRRDTKSGGRSKTHKILRN